MSQLSQLLLVLLFCGLVSSLLDQSKYLPRKKGLKLYNKEYFVRHPWHNVTYGAAAPNIINGIIEISKGTSGKYELDKASGLLVLDRVLFSAVHYPINYGFIPKTLSDDGDPLDIMIFCSVDIQPLTLVEARVLGVMRMIDTGEGDNKILAVANHDVNFANYKTLADVPQHQLDLIRAFFEDYKKLENKTVVVTGFEGQQAAYIEIENDIFIYKYTYGN